MLAAFVQAFFLGLAVFLSALAALRVAALLDRAARAIVGVMARARA